MSDVVAKLDDLGQAAWIAVMVLGFVLFWPVGLSILAYLIWSGRMSCGRTSSWSGDGQSRWERKMARFQEKMERWQARSGGMSDRGQRFAGGYAGGFAPSGNGAFDDYRTDTMRRLEEEFTEFKTFLDRLRVAKDKAEFDQFMADRRNRPEAGPGQGQGPAGQAPSSDPWPKT